MSRRLAWLVPVFAAVLAAAPTAASAQDKPPESKPTRAPGEVKPVGEYSGVGGADGGARTAIGKAGKHPRVFWVGFRAREGGGAQLFVQLDREVAASQAIEDGKLVLALGDARVVSRNSLRWLDTRFFDSSVARVDPRTARRGRKAKGPAGLHLVISFKDGTAAAEGQLSSAQGKDGLTYLTVDFPSATR